MLSGLTKQIVKIPKILIKMSVEDVKAHLKAKTRHKRKTEPAKGSRRKDKKKSQSQAEGKVMGRKTFFLAGGLCFFLPCKSRAGAPVPWHAIFLPLRQLGTRRQAPVWVVRPVRATDMWEQELGNECSSLLDRGRRAMSFRLWVWESSQVFRETGPGALFARSDASTCR
jgi:hypothetical protein